MDEPAVHRADLFSAPPTRTASSGTTENVFGVVSLFSGRWCHRDGHLRLLVRRADTTASGSMALITLLAGHSARSGRRTVVCLARARLFRAASLGFGDSRITPAIRVCRHRGRGGRGAGWSSDICSRHRGDPESGPLPDPALRTSASDGCFGPVMASGSRYRRLGLHASSATRRS